MTAPLKQRSSTAPALVVDSVAVPLLCGVSGLLRWYRLGDWPLRTSEVDWLLQLEGGARSGPLDAAARAFLNACGNPGLALRVVPFLAGVLGLPLLYGVARGVAGRYVALALLVLLTASPYHLFLSTVGSTDVLFFTCSAAGFLLLLGPSSGRGALATLGGLVLWAAGLTAEHLQAAFLEVPPIGGHQTVVDLLYDVALAVPLLAAVGLLQRLRSTPRSGLLLLGALLVSAASGVRNHTAALDAVTPGLYVAASLAGGTLLEVLHPRLLAQTAMAVLLVTPGLPVALSQLIDHGSYDVPGVAAAFAAAQRPRDPVVALGAPLAELALGVPCGELPADPSTLESQLPANGHAFVVLLLERGRLAREGGDAELARWIEQHMHLLARNAPRRLDRYRFEVRLYRWNASTE